MSTWPKPLIVQRIHISNEHVSRWIVYADVDIDRRWTRVVRGSKTFRPIRPVS